MQPQGIQMDNVSVVFETAAATVTAVKNVTQQVPHASFVSIVGPSGCGKSTLLAVIAGLVWAGHQTAPSNPGAGDDALAQVLADPEIDLEASSDYGRVFAELLAAPAGLTRRTSVLIVGDGRSGGLPDGAGDLAELRRRVHRLAWITPEPERYWAQATCAMPAYREHCDAVVTARDADQLIERAAELGNALR